MSKTGQFCPDCKTCGWLGHGKYPDGRPYVTCEFYGTFLKDMIETECKRKMTTEEVMRFKTQNAERLLKTKRNERKGKR